MNKVSQAIFLIIVFAIFCGTRFSNLNQVKPDDDTFSWLYRINYYPWVVMSNLKGQDIGDNRDLKYSGTISYHPGVTIMTLSGISTKIGKSLVKNYEPCAYRDFSCKTLGYELFIAKLPLVLISGLLFIASIFWLAKVFSYRAILIWIAAILFEPLIISSSQLIHLDFLFGMFVVSAMSAAIYSIKFSRQNFMFAAGALMGFALLTRFAGVFFLPGILAAFFYVDHKKFFKNVLYFAFGGFTAFILFYPAMWVAPLETLTYIIKSSLEISDNLAEVMPAYQIYWNNLTWYYSIYSIALSIYLIWTLVVGGASAFVLPMKNKRLVLAFVIIYIAYFGFVNLSDKLYIRYILPVVIGLTIPSSIGVYNLFFKTQQKVQKTTTHAKI